MDPGSEAYFTLYRKGWEGAADSYKEGFGLHLEEISRRLAGLLSAPLTPPVLDVACGPGTAMRAVSGLHRTGPFVGCDFSYRMTEHARRTLSGSFAVVADQDRLPFAPGSIGTLLSSMGTIFSRDPDRQFNTLGGLIKRGGQLGFSAWGLPQECALGEVLRRVVLKWPYPLEGSLPPLESPYSPGRSEWLERRAEEAGLRIRTVESDWLVFRFPDPAAAAREVIGTGRFALLLSGHPERKKELQSLAEDLFQSFQESQSQKVELANRYHLFVLDRIAS